MSGNCPRGSGLLLASGLLSLCFAVGWILHYSVASEAGGTAQKRTLQKRTLDATNSSFDRIVPSVETVVPTNQKSANHSSGNFSVTIRKPTGPPRIDTGLRDSAGRPITASCSTCHATRPANHANRTLADFDEFHQTMIFAHGKVSCLSCHNPNDYDTLHLADGRLVEFVEVMTLCAQCHGPQTRDYEHGAHGGMIGYWDLSRGPRTRNNCVDCHDPHSPSFPAMQPTFKPYDRFLGGNEDSEANQHE
jgi:formate-dependent nitrite reductase cytochrome c552 subunit